MSTGVCRKVTPLLEAFQDGELVPEMVLEVEQHLVECELCTERVKLNRAIKLSTRRAVHGADMVSAAFRERIAAALLAEREREDIVDSIAEHEGRSRMLSWRTMGPMAAAAALTLVWAANTNAPHRAGQKAQNASAYSPTPASVEQLIEQLIDNHLQSQSPQVTEPSLLNQLEPQVGVPLTLPSLKEYGGRWEGGSVVPVNNQRAASLRYRVGDHRVTLYVYNSSRVPIEGKLKRRMVRDEAVYVGSSRGFSIAATQRRGVGYAIASDLNGDESAELIAAVY